MRTMSDTFHLIPRNGVWYYRRRVPENLIPALGRKYLQYSLETRIKAEAKKRRTIADLEADALFERHEMGLADGVGDNGHDTRRLSFSVLTDHLRRYVDQQDQRFQGQLNESPTSSEQLADMREEVDRELSALSNPDSPHRAEWVGVTWQRMVNEAGGAPEEGVSGRFVEAVHRALVEISRRKQARVSGQFDRAFFDALFDPARKPVPSFGDLAEQYVTEKLNEAEINNISRKRTDKVQANIALIREIVGAKTSVSAIDYDVCQKVRTSLARTPTNRTKLFPTLPLEKAIERAAGLGKTTLSTTTQNQYLDTFRDILQLAVAKQLLVSNPAQGIRALKRETLSADEKKLSWTDYQIRDFFTSDFYRSCAAAAPEPYARGDREWRFWVPLICLFMGLRPNEACQLLVDDLKVTAKGTHYLDIVATADDEAPLSAKTVKTASSRRRIPVHPELVRIGILDFINCQRKSKSAPRLFPTLKPDGYGNWASKALRSFNRTFIPQAITLVERQSFYSLRHNFRDALRRCKAPPESLEALGGWSQGKVTSSNYGDKRNPDLHVEWMEKVSFPGLKLDFLYVA